MSINFGSSFRKRMKSAPVRQWAIGLLSLLTGCFSGCLPAGRIIDPANGNNVPILGSFQGRAETDVKIVEPAFLPRFPELTKPKVALVWQFIGPKEYTFDATSTLVRNANPPYDFTLTLKNPPGKEILDAPDLAIASFWLYQDGNGNGKMDCLLHPSLLAMNLSVDTMYADFLASVDRLLEVSEVKAKRVPVVETYYVGKYGTTMRKVGDKLDTIWAGTEKGLPGFSEPWITVLYNRFRILNHASRWEYFFALRKRANDYYNIPKPAEGFAAAYDFPYERKLFPKPGMEEEFEKRVQAATLSSALFGLGYTFMRSAAVDGKWTDYPYDNRKEDCPDWVAGRSRQHVLLYFKDRAALNELLEAERGSSFSVTGKEKLHLGYNLVSCGGNYDCQVLDAADSAFIDLGTTEDFFNPPDVPLVKPVADPHEAPASPSRLRKLAGAYTFQPFHPFCMSVEQGNLWVSIPDQGQFRLLAADSLDYFTPASDLQIQIVGTPEHTEKLLLYAGDKRYVAVFDSSQAVPEAIAEKMQALAARTRVSVAAAALKPLAGRYDFGGDTLVVTAGGEGDSLLVKVPGLMPHWFHAASESVFFSPWSDRRITFRRNDQGAVTDLEAMLGDSAVTAPSLDYPARIQAALFPGFSAEPDSGASASEGSFRDLYVGTDGKGHYPGSADARFVGAGNGWVTSFDQGLPGDPISLANGGSLLFKADGIKGAGAGLDMLLRRDMRAGAARARFRLRGGSDPAHSDRVLCDDFWVTFSGDSARVVLKAWPVPADPYYIKLERVRTADPAPAIALDSYQLLISRGPHAHP